MQVATLVTDLVWVMFVYLHGTAALRITSDMAWTLVARLKKDYSAGSLARSSDGMISAIDASGNDGTGTTSGQSVCLHGTAALRITSDVALTLMASLNAIILENN